MPPISGTVVGAVIVPSDTADTYPVTDPQYGKGALRTVATTTVRNAITIPRLEKGMLVHVTADGITYQLKDSWTGGLSVDGDWQVAIGAGGGVEGRGNGIENSLAYWLDANTLGCDTFLRKNPDTFAVENEAGFACSDYDVDTVRYIDTAGSDSNSGTAPGSATAWETPGYALYRCLMDGPGKYVIHCAAGTYNTVSVNIPDYLGRDDTEGSLIEIIGDETTPANVVFDGSSTIINHNSINTKVRIAGVRFTGAGTNTVIAQNSSTLYIRNCEADTFTSFARLNNGSSIYLESGTTTLIDTFKGIFADNGSKVIASGNLTIGPPNNSQPCIMFDTYVSSVSFAQGATYTLAGSGVGGSGYHFRARNSSIYLGTFNTFSQSDVTGFCNIDAGTYIDCGSNNSITSTGPSNIMQISGGSFVEDGTSTTWNFSSIPPDGIILKSGGMISTPAILYHGILVGGYLVEYITYASDDNYTRYALDNRYTEKVCFTVLGEQVQGTSGASICPSGYTSVAYPLYRAESKCFVKRLTVKARIGTTTGVTDTYTIYKNGSATALSVSMTNTSSVSVAGAIELVTGDFVDVRTTTSIFSAAQDFTIAFEIQLLEAS